MKQVKLLFSIIFSFITVVCFGQLMPLADEAITLNTQNGAIHGKILLAFSFFISVAASIASTR